MRLIPVLVAVSQATLERGSSARQASRIASETWSQILSVISVASVRTKAQPIHFAAPKLTRVSLTDRLGGEEEVAWGERVGGGTVGGHGEQSGGREGGEGYEVVKDRTRRDGLKFIGPRPPNTIARYHAILARAHSQR